MNALKIEQLPLILTGPILRQTEPQRVTVWLALKQACEVQLTIKKTSQEGDQIEESIVLQGSRETVRLGEHLHIVAVSAFPQRSGQLMPQQIYAYDLSFTPWPASQSNPDSPDCSGLQTLSLQEALCSPTVLPISISYFKHGLPTFVMSPSDINQLRIFHGSCRRIHDRSWDALPILDAAIAHTAHSPSERPHQLFFTGDQIYGDEVADPLLWAILQISQVLLGWEERLQDDKGQDIPPSQLQVGQRQPIAEQQAGFTASHQGKSEKTRNHLFRFSEYVIAYLFAWSDCLWNFPFPDGTTLGLTGKAAKQWNQQVRDMTQFAQSQPCVHRALANIPTYMIFDDHDVSDDWNLNQEWCLRVLGKPLGRQVVRNALLAYALFQGWGNTPEQFEVSHPGQCLLQATQQWCAAKGDCQDSALHLTQILGLPAADPGAHLPQLKQDRDAVILNRSAHALTWHYRVRGTSHEVLVLDTRTQRGYPVDGPTDAIPQLLSPSAFEQQLQPLLQAIEREEELSNNRSSVKVTFVIAPTNLFSLKILDHLQSLGHFFGKSFDIDIGDSWTLESSTRAKLLAYLLRMRSHLIVLSGDIHFSATIHLNYWSRQWQDRSVPASMLQKKHHAQYLKVVPTSYHVLVQCTSSAICNSEPLIKILHTRIKSLLPERTRRWMGWQGAEEIEVGFWMNSRMTRFLRRTLAAIANFFQISSVLDLQPSFPDRPPDWQYETHWVKRQPAIAPDWGTVLPWEKPLHNPTKTRQLNWAKRLWHTKWLQEGQEVVGSNNIGLVRFDLSQKPHSSDATLPQTVIHELYWYAPWSKVPHIVCSQYKTDLMQYLRAQER